VGPYIPYGLFQTTGEMCAKSGSDQFRNVDLYKVQTNKQTFIFIYKIYKKFIYIYIYIYTHIYMNIFIYKIYRKFLYIYTCVYIGFIYIYI